MLVRLAEANTDVQLFYGNTGMQWTKSCIPFLLEMVTNVFKRDKELVNLDDLTTGVTKIEVYALLSVDDGYKISLAANQKDHMSDVISPYINGVECVVK